MERDCYSITMTHIQSGESTLSPKVINKHNADLKIISGHSNLQGPHDSQQTNTYIGRVTTFWKLEYGSLNNLQALLLFFKSNLHISEMNALNLTDNKLVLQHSLCHHFVIHGFHLK